MKATKAKKPTAAHAVELARQYVMQRDARLAKDKEAAELKEIETALKQELMDTLRALGISTVGDSQRNYSLVTKLEPQADDWARIRDHIRKTGEFELMYQRLNNTAVKERWDRGEEVPGVGKFPVDTLSITKAKGAK
jgi:hypothetical protein